MCIFFFEFRRVFYLPYIFTAVVRFVLLNDDFYGRESFFCCRRCLLFVPLMAYSLLLVRRAGHSLRHEIGCRLGSLAEWNNPHLHS